MAGKRFLTVNSGELKIVDIEKAAGVTEPTPENDSADEEEERGEEL